MFSIKQLDQPAACETPFEFEVKDNTDEGTGLFLSVIGGEAPAVSEFFQKHVQKRRVQQALDEKSDPRGKRVHVPPIADDVEFATRLTAIRVVGWRGNIEEPYSPENAIDLCKANPWSVREQINAQSEEMKNFPLGGRKSSSVTSAS